MGKIGWEHCLGKARALGLISHTKHKNILEKVLPRNTKCLFTQTECDVYH